MMMVSTSYLITTTLQPTPWAVHLQPTGATVSLNETNIVVTERDDINTTVDICIVLANNMRDLQRDIVVYLTVMPDNANSKSCSLLGWYSWWKCYYTLIYGLTSCKQFSM